MTLKDWFEREVKVREMTVAAALDEIQASTGVSKTTLKSMVYGGLRLSSRYTEKAEALSKHTGGVVAVGELLR